jgi:hypothetical protein
LVKVTNKCHYNGYLIYYLLFNHYRLHPEESTNWWFNILTLHIVLPHFHYARALTLLHPIFGNPEYMFCFNLLWHLSACQMCWKTKFSTEKFCPCTTLLRFTGSHVTCFSLWIEDFLMMKPVLTIHYTFHNSGHNRILILCICTPRHTYIFQLLYIGLYALNGTFYTQYCISPWCMLSVNIYIEPSTLMWNMVFT